MEACAFMSGITDYNGAHGTTVTGVVLIVFVTPVFVPPSFLQPTSKGMTLTELPASLQLNIMQRLSDGRDLVSLGQVCPTLGALTEDRLLWKRLCQYHFTDRQACTDKRMTEYMQTATRWTKRGSGFREDSFSVS